MNMWSKTGASPATLHASAESQEPEIILDLSRLLSRVLHPTPTGIDRVEMAYARELMRAVPHRLGFAAVHPSGLYGRLERDAALAFLDETELFWSGAGKRSGAQLHLHALSKLLKLRPQRVPAASSNRARIYLQASPHHLDKPGLVDRILMREGARFVCLVHDLIPIQFPEYARPGGADQHRQRMNTLGRYADAVITNSGATRDAFLNHLSAEERVPLVTVAHLGTHHAATRRRPPAIDIPYFVYIGTIEPRKNHLLLLNLWRRMAEDRGGKSIPKLVLVGRRGWENENVLDMLDRCPSLGDHVIEASRMADGDVEDLIASARALLLPSFAEGYGMPIAEALQIGVPVICSDLPAHREVGGAVPEYLDPLDGPGWRAAISDYAAEKSPRCQAQRARMRRWRAPEWRDHLNTVLDVCGEIAVQAPRLPR